MTDRSLKSLAILLAGLFSNEGRGWRALLPRIGLVRESAEYDAEESAVPPSAADSSH